MGMTTPRVRRLQEKKLKASVRRPVRMRTVVDKARLWWVCGLFMANSRHRYSLKDLCKECGLSYRTICHILAEDLPKPPGGMPMVEKIIAAARKRGIVLLPSQFQVVVQPSQESSQSE